jgi:hypothetical protein
MKNLYAFVVMLFACVSAGFAQTTLFSDTFESYTAGSKLVQQAPGTDWTTWSNAPGGPEDPVVSNAFANAGTKSVKIVPNNDLVLKLNDKTTGRYQLSMFVRVATGKIGYFNVLQDFAAGNSLYGMEVYFNADGTGTVNAGGEGTGNFTYTQGSWFPVNVIVDIDDDFATLYINNAEVVSWVWSGGSAGANTLQKLDAVDFYGPTSGGTAECYYDDVQFIQQPALTGPSGLTATVNGSDVTLDWTAASGSPANYSVIRNGKVVNSAVSGTSYTDLHVYPGTYSYEVKAQYTGLGYSPSSNKADAVIAGGVERTKVLFEIATGTWCQYCPGAAKGADDLVNNGKEVAIIEYHSGDSYENQAANDRINYYGVTGFPTTEVDGVLEMVGGNATTSLYPSYLNLYNQRINVPSIHTMDLKMEHLSGDMYRATVTIEQMNNYFASGLVLLTALTESHIPENWLGGLHEVNFVCRDMFPTAAGTDLDFSSSPTQTLTFDFPVTGYVYENLEFIAFVQDQASRENVQSVSYRMLFTGMGENKKYGISLYPNPATEQITIESGSPEPISYTITDATGKTVVPMTKASENQININVSSWNTGLYILRTRDGITRKFSVVNP